MESTRAMSQRGCPKPPRTRDTPSLHPRLQRMEPESGLGEQTRAGFEKGKSQPASARSSALLLSGPFGHQPQATALFQAWAGIPSGVSRAL